MGDGQLQYHKRNRNPHQKLEGIWSLILFGLLQWRCLHEQLKLHAPLHLHVFAVHFPLKHKHLRPVDLIWICLRILNTVVKVNLYNEINKGEAILRIAAAAAGEGTKVEKGPRVRSGFKD